MWSMDRQHISEIWEQTVPKMQTILVFKPFCRLKDLNNEILLGVFIYSIPR